MANYTYIGAQWDDAVIYWYYDGDPIYYDDVAEAFERWEDLLSIDFVEADSAQKADVTVEFGYIDGYGGTLGYAEMSYISTNFLDVAVVIDTGEQWSYDAQLGTYVTPDGYALYSVLLHEIGHAIGLDHSSNEATLMYPYVNAGLSEVSYWDLYGAQHLYGANAYAPAGWVNGWSTDAWFWGWNWAQGVYDAPGDGWDFETGWAYGLYSWAGTAGYGWAKNVWFWGDHWVWYGTKLVAELANDGLDFEASAYGWAYQRLDWRYGWGSNAKFWGWNWTFGGIYDAPNDGWDFESGWAYGLYVWAGSSYYGWAKGIWFWGDHWVWDGTTLIADAAFDAWDIESIAHGWHLV